MTQFFDFEADFVDSLRCIPMVVRFKLDTCGVKLKLDHWHRFTPDTRRQLVDAPCSTEQEVQSYRQLLHHLVQLQTGSAPADLPVDPYPAWMDASTIPPSVQEKAQQLGVGLQTTQWSSLTPIQRFVLIKLSRSNHENANFLPALQEFQMVTPPAP